MKKFYGLIALLSLVLVIAACGADDASKGDTDKGKDKADKEDKNSAVEIFSWWTGAGEEDGRLG